jgi:hypothetical protein
LRKEEEGRLRKEEEEKKKEEEAQDINPIDTNPFENPFNTLGIAMTRAHFPLGELGLSAFTSSKLDKVGGLYSFVFDKVRGDILKKYHNNINLP